MYIQFVDCEWLPHLQEVLKVLLFGLSREPCDISSDTERELNYVSQESLHLKTTLCVCAASLQ